MSWLNRNIVARISPGWALERERKAHALKAYYDAAEAGRLRKSRVIRASATNEIDRDGAKLRGLARYLECNLDFAKGALDTLVAHVVGSGVFPEPQVKLKDGAPATEFNTALLTLFKDWIENPEVTWDMDYYTVQRMVCRSWLRDGEVLAKLVSGPADAINHGTVVPFSLELLEADYLPFDRNSPSPRIVNGVELNAWNKPLAYHVYKQHPGDGYSVSTETTRISSDRMIHLKHMTRLHQVRGVSLFASVLNRFDDIKEIDESERVAARVAAAMAGFIKKGTPDLYQPPAVGEDGKPVYRNIDITPGMIFDDLAPGEDVGTINSNRPNNALIPFRDSQLRSAAAGLGTSFSSLSRNYNGTYSAQRQELVEARRHYETLTSYFVRRFAHVVWQAFVQAAMASRKAEPGKGVDLATVYDATHTAPPLLWIDPVKEAEANKLMQQMGYKSRSEIIRERGRTPDEVNQEIVRGRDEAERIGLALDEDAGPEGAREAYVEPIASGGFRVFKGGRVGSPVTQRPPTPSGGPPVAG